MTSYRRVSLAPVSPQGHMPIPMEIKEVKAALTMIFTRSFHLDTDTVSRKCFILMLGMFDWTLISSLACSLPCLRACSIGVACWEARSVAAVLFLKSSKLCSGGRSNHFGFSGVISQ